MNVIIQPRKVDVSNMCWQRIIRSFIYRIAPFVKDDARYLKMRWRAYMDYPLNLENPHTFNEKLQWLKLHDRRPEYSIMVDKYEAKKYVSGIIGEEHIIPTIAIYDRVEEIDFDALPNQFVLKCTHDSGGIVICKDKKMLNREDAIKKLKQGLKKNYYYQNREWPYKDVKPRIIAEQYMANGEGEELVDYKIHSFNGKPKIILVCKDRYKDSGLTEDFFSLQWEHLDILRPNHRNSKTELEKPKGLEEMITLSEKLSKSIPFLRTDFYAVSNKVFFGELTFFPACGMKPFIPREWDYLLGSYIDLSKLVKR